jgi:hypothetical protein
VLDAFWDSKGYISADEYRRFCNSTVPLARLTQRVWTAGNTFSAQLELAHFGPSPLEEMPVYWRVVDRRGQTRASGEFDPRSYPVGNNSPIGTVSFPLDATSQAEALKLVVGLGPDPSNRRAFSRSVRRARQIVGLDQRPIENDWDFWVYPQAVPTHPSPNVLVTDRLSNELFDHLTNGGDVLLVPPTHSIANSVQLGFSPIFWNTAWTDNQLPHTLGILCNPNHPALLHFPTEFHTNWQWWDLISSGAATVMDDLPPGLRPVVQVVDDWFKNRKLGLIFEARLGQGRLVFTSLDLRSHLDQRPVARQMLHSLLRYMDSRAFNPSQEITPDHLARLLQ